MVKTKKTLILVLLALVLSMQSVLAVYLLARIEGAPLNVREKVNGKIQYNIENDVFGAWDLTDIQHGEHWVVRMTTIDAGYAGNVEIAWFLESYDGTVWNVVPLTTVFTACVLTGEAGQFVYASADGTLTDNQDWGLYTDAVGTFRVVAEITEGEGPV